MYAVTTRAEHLLDGGPTALFEGHEYGSGSTFFWVDNASGEGPPLHRHPYSETWAVVAGEVTVTADDDEIAMGQGDILVVGPGTPHTFRATGRERLQMLCIHASPRLVEVWLEGPDAERTGPELP